MNIQIIVGSIREGRVAFKVAEWLLKEIQKLEDAESGRGLTIVPLKVYNKGKKVKIDIAIVRGKKQFDKRASIQKRETDRDIERTLKRGE